MKHHLSVVIELRRRKYYLFHALWRPKIERLPRVQKFRGLILTLSISLEDSLQTCGIQEE